MLSATGSTGVDVTSGVGVVTIGVSGGGRRGVGGTGIVVGSSVAPGGAIPAGMRVGHGVGAAAVSAGVAVGALITTSPAGTKNGVGTPRRTGPTVASAGSSSTVTPARGRFIAHAWPSS